MYVSDIHGTQYAYIPGRGTYHRLINGVDLTSDVDKAKNINSNDFYPLKKLLDNILFHRVESSSTLLTETDVEIIMSEEARLQGGGAK